MTAENPNGQAKEEALVQNKAVAGRPGGGMSGIGSGTRAVAGGGGRVSACATTVDKVSVIDRRTDIIVSESASM